jgi:hypothetical protein
VADYWRVRRWGTEGEAAQLAHMEFTRWRQQTEEAAAELTRASVATDTCRAFLDIISDRLAEWGTEPVPGSADELAAAARFEHRIGWRLRNLQLDPVQVALLADGVRTDPVVPLDSPVAARPKQFAPTGIWSARLQLMYAAATRPDLYQRLRSGEEPLDDHPEASDADLACLLGDYADAEPAYEAEISADETRRPVWEAWAGLVHCYAHTRPGPAADVLRAQPEIVAAVHAAVTAGGVDLSPYETARRLALILP